MKISEMLLREDFYKINEETLRTFFGNCAKGETLYVYPQLNAIITRKPSKNVKKYLYNEYKVRGSLLKALVVKAYVFACLNSNGVLAAKKINIPNEMNAHKLIYPCNKKYRIFDFERDTVSVIPKCGFPTNDLEREIEFRSNNTAPFIPALVSYSENNYSENIIDGLPLARITDNFEGFCEEAIEILEQYAEKTGKVTKKISKEYALELRSVIDGFINRKSKYVDETVLEKIVTKLIESINDETITITLSHGDLQPGNVWVDKDGKIFIIDWESWNQRSIWYDKAVMFGNIRSKGLSEYIKSNDINTQTAIVCLEDIIFRLTELYNLPLDYGEKDFNIYIKSLDF